MLRIKFYIVADDKRHDDSQDRLVRTLDIKEHSNHWDTGTYSAKFYINRHTPNATQPYMRDYVKELPYKEYSHEKITYLVLKKYLEDRNLIDLPD